MVSDDVLSFQDHLHIRYIATTSRGLSGARRMIVCRDGPVSDSEKLLMVNDVTRFADMLKRQKVFEIRQSQDENRSGECLMKLKLCPGPVLWVRDSCNRYIGNVRLNIGVGGGRFKNGSMGIGVMLLDAEGMPVATVERKFVKEPDGSCHRYLTFKCARSGAVLAICRLFKADLRPLAKPARVIVLDFHSQLIVSFDATGDLRRLCLASLLALQTWTEPRRRFKHLC